MTRQTVPTAALPWWKRLFPRRSGKTRLSVASIHTGGSSSTPETPSSMTGITLTTSKDASPSPYTTTTWTPETSMGLVTWPCSDQTKKFVMSPWDRESITCVSPYLGPSSIPSPRPPTPSWETDPDSPTR